MRLQTTCIIHFSLIDLKTEFFYQLMSGLITTVSNLSIQFDIFQKLVFSQDS